MKFRFKILLSIWGVVLSLLVITFFIINYWTRSRIEDAFSEQLRSNRSTLNGIVGLQSEILSRGCQVIAESPRLRAVVELQDPKTAYQLSQELNQTTASDLLVLTDRHGKSLVQLVFGNRIEDDVAGRASVQQALRSGSTADVWFLGNRIFRVSSVPLLVDREMVGTLTLGFAITQEELARLKQWTNHSEIILTNDRDVVLSTISFADHDGLMTSLASSGMLAESDSAIVLKVKAANDVFLGTAFQLNKPESTARPIKYLIIKSTDRELSRSLNPILGAFGLISVVFLALTTLIGHAISVGMTRPINALVQGTTEVSKGNYDHIIAVSGRDELSFLAQRFGDMSRSLKEKISELGRLNQDLIARNSELDETVQKLKEAQEELVKSERLAATGKLTAQLAHEINNPIHNIQSCLKTSLGRLPSETQGRDLIEVAYEEVTRMSKLTRQLLDFYRTSFVPEETMPVDLNVLVKEVLQSFGDELIRNRIDVKPDLSADLPMVQGSLDKLKQVFLNLVLNARDAMPGGGHLQIRTAQENGFVKVSIGDSGVGILKENLGKIFDAFFTTKSKVSGVGLGLSVSYGIISQHRGTIHVTSTPGEGSTFVVSLPVQPQEQRLTSA
ncbi:MAG: ATP-binding protein [Ignavibacteriales bacterium]|nr:ATP-binding protein [Ignavibacteriales bacterium]